MQRREFLKLAGCYVAAISTLGLVTSCRTSKKNNDAHFPQGVASGDPGPSSIMLWTRAEPIVDSPTIEVILELAEDDQFTQIIGQSQYIVSADSDYTLRLLIEELSPNKIYYYRFRSGDTYSITGRTQTAPDITSSEAVKLAFVSCQERKHGFYNAYRRMLIDDLNAKPNDKIQFVLHLGDFIYETRNDPLQLATDGINQTIETDLLNSDQIPRGLDPFIDGGKTTNGIEFALTLADYRQLYKQYLADPDLQAARARWPFVTIWDDHEFSDDCWQSEANYQDQGLNSSTNEPSQQRKVAANQAWFEYIPANLMKPETTESDLHHSHDFQFVAVNNTPNNRINLENMASNEDNINAINSLNIYRNFQFGSLFQLLLTDNRSYRSDHALPEDISGNLDLFLSSRATVPMALQNELDAGKTANNGDPSSFLFIGSLVFNPRRFSPPGTMLGVKQKEWFKETLLRANTRWKIWGNSVPIMRFLLNLSALDDNMNDLLLSIDSWDGYNSERNELMQFIVENDIKNIVSLSGDLHAHYAGEVWSDFDVSSEEKQVTMIEAVCGAISSVSQFSAAERLTRHAGQESQLRQLVSFDERELATAGNNPIVNNFNNTILNGCISGISAAQDNDLDLIKANKDPNHNAHLVYADGDANGYGLATINYNEIILELVTINSLNSPSDEAIKQKRKAKFVIPHVQAGANAVISEPEFEGEKPFPFAKET